MAFSINQIILCGHLGRDAETKIVAGGLSLSSFSVATKHGVKKGEQWENVTTWHNVILWKSEKLAPSLIKGALVTVRGRQDHRKYEGKDGTTKYASEIVAEDVIVGSASSGDAAPSKPAQRQPPQPAAQSWDNSTIDDDSVPF